MGSFMVLKYIAMMVMRIMSVTGMNLLLYSNGSSSGRLTMNATSMGESRSSDTSICLLMMMLRFFTSWFTADNLGK